MISFAALQGPLLIAHRGASAEHVENSLPAFHGALALGADVLESDVHITRDLCPVLAHDADGLRVANDPRAIGACTLDEISAWNLAPDAAEPCCIPSLDAALAALPHALFNLDLKVHDARAIPCVLEVIARHDAAPRVLLTSFSASITRALRTRGYKGPIGLGQAEAALAVFAPRSVLRMQRAVFGRPNTRLQIPLDFHGLSLTRSALIDKLRTLSIPIDYWVVNDPEIASDLLARGASGIVTDDVRAMREVFATSPHTAGWRARHS